MKPRVDIGGASFGPEALQAAGIAFDAAWAEVAGHFGTDKQEEARDRLATAIMSVAGADNTDPQVLRNIGLEAVARAYPDLVL